MCLKTRLRSDSGSFSHISRLSPSCCAMKKPSHHLTPFMLIEAWESSAHTNIGTGNREHLPGTALRQALCVRVKVVPGEEPRRKSAYFWGPKQ